MFFQQLYWEKSKKTLWRRRVHAFHTIWPSYLLSYIHCILCNFIHFEPWIWSRYWSWSLVKILEYFWSRIWSWRLVKVFKLKFGFTLVRALILAWVYCAFGNVLLFSHRTTKASKLFCPLLINFYLPGDRRRHSGSCRN